MYIFELYSPGSFSTWQVIDEALMIEFEFFRDLDQLYIHESSGEHGQLLSEWETKHFDICISLELLLDRRGLVE